MSQEFSRSDGGGGDLLKFKLNAGLGLKGIEVAA